MKDIEEIVPNSYVEVIYLPKIETPD